MFRPHTPSSAAFKPVPTRNFSILHAFAEEITKRETEEKAKEPQSYSDSKYIPSLEATQRPSLSSSIALPGISTLVDVPHFNKATGFSTSPASPAHAAASFHGSATWASRSLDNHQPLARPQSESILTLVEGFNAPVEQEQPGGRCNTNQHLPRQTVELNMEALSWHLRNTYASHFQHAGTAPSVAPQDLKVKVLVYGYDRNQCTKKILDEVGESFFFQQNGKYVSPFSNLIVKHSSHMNGSALGLRFALYAKIGEKTEEICFIDSFDFRTVTRKGSRKRVKNMSRLASSLVEDCVQNDGGEGSGSSSKRSRFASPSHGSEDKRNLVPAVALQPKPSLLPAPPPTNPSIVFDSYHISKQPFSIHRFAAPSDAPSPSSSSASSSLTTSPTTPVSTAYSCSISPTYGFVSDALPTYILLEVVSVFSAKSPSTSSSFDEYISKLLNGAVLPIVYFGDRQSTDVHISGTKIFARLPATSAPGTVSVNISFGELQLRASSPFTYLNPLDQKDLQTFLRLYVESAKTSK